MSAHTSGPRIDDAADESSTILDGDDRRPSLEQETVVSDYGTVTEYASRLDLGHLNLVSWKAGAQGKVYLGGIGEAEDEESPRTKFHAISDVICHPSKPPAPLRGSRKPLPPTTSGPPTIPKPPPDGFYQPYLDSITKPLPADAAQTGVESLWHAWEQARRGVKSGVSVTPGEAPARQPEEELDDLAAVDDMFFAEAFDLAAPHTWHAVLGSDTTNSHDAQQDLSHQLDVLEAHLVSEISERTPQFFDALANLQSLTDQTSACLSRLTALRSQLAALDGGTAIRGLAVVERQQDLAVGRMTERALGQVEGVVAAVEVVRQVADQGDWVAAQRGLEDVGRWWARAMPARRGKEGIDATKSNGDHVKDGKHVLTQVKEEDEDDVVDPPATEPTSTSPASDTAPFIPLATLPALQYIPDEMSSIAETIQDQLELSLACICAAILDTTPRIQVADDTSGGKPSQAQNKPRQWRIRPDDEARVRSTFSAQISGLLHAFWRTDRPPNTPGAEPPASPRPYTSCVTRIEIVWRVAVMKCIKEGMRQLLQLGEADGEAEGGADAPANGAAKGQSLVDTLKDMTQERFVSISEQMYETMVARIELVRVLGEVLETQLAQTKPSEPTILAQVLGGEAAATTANGSADFIEPILHSAVDLANARASKILLTRTEIHAELDLDRFVGVYHNAWQFILWSEALVGRVVGSLRGVVVAQARAFLVRYHSARLQESAKLVEEEQWTQVEVPADAQRVVDSLVRSAMSDPAGYAVGSSTPAEENGQLAQPGSSTAPSISTEKTLKIEDQSFSTVSATLRSVVLLQDYAKVVVSLDVIVTDTMNRIVEYLKSFNSRTCQVVLGAGAMRSAGLKNITAKHLALASQSLSIIISLTPYIREFVRRHLNPKQAVVLIEFDKLKRDYQEHQYEIHAKLISIMADRLTVHCGTLRMIDWEAKPASPTNGYMEQLVKEITTLHKVLNKYLGTSTVHSIMGQVLDATNAKLSEEYGKVEFKSEDAKKRMMQDVSYIVDRTKQLTDPSLPSPITPLEELVKAKTFPRRAAHMSNALNGLLRRKNDAASSSTTSLNDSPTLAQSEKDAPEIEDDEDALAASNSLETNVDQQERTTEDRQENAAEEEELKSADPVDSGTAATAITVPEPKQIIPETTSADDLLKQEPEPTAQAATVQQTIAQEIEQAPIEAAAERPQSPPPTL